MLQKNKLKKHKSVCENYDCYVEMPEEDNKILKYNHGQKSMMQPFAIYFDFESLLEKIHTYPTDLEKSSTTKINKHIPSNYSLFTCCLFVVYMLFICYLHVVYLLFTCCLHVVYLLFTCCLFVVYMLFI